MKKIAVVLSVAALALLALPQAPTHAQQEEVVTVKLATQNNSGVFGGGRLTRAGDGQTRVELTLEGGDAATAMPAHIHKGTCANLDPRPAFPLENVVGGGSDSTVDVSLDELTTGGYAINVHKSATEASVFVACGDILAMEVLPAPAGESGLGAGETAGTVGMPRTGSEQRPWALLVGLGLLALASLGAGLRLARRRA
jgi:LPXTG-motif cell wall-anchored protein